MLLSEITLFRVNLPRKFSFFRDHPLSGPGYGDFCDQKKWTTSGSTTLTVRRPIELTSPDVAPCLSIKLQEFEAPEMASEATDLKLESMYKAPWAIPDPEPVVLDLETFINDTINCGLGLHVFNIACPIENDLVEGALRLWVASRFIESGWRVAYTESPIKLSVHKSDPSRLMIPSYPDYQLASIIIERILQPRAKDILRDIAEKLEDSKHHDVRSTCIVIFILLDSIERQLKFQAEFAAKRHYAKRYMDTEIIKDLVDGANTLLENFHSFRQRLSSSAPVDWLQREVAGSGGDVTRTRSDNTMSSEEVDTPGRYTQQMFSESAKWEREVFVAAKSESALQTASGC